MERFVGASGSRKTAIYYKAVVAVPDLVRGLFVEVVLADDDPDCPAVLIVNAHEQRG